MQAYQGGLRGASGVSGYDIVSSTMPDTWGWSSKPTRNHCAVANVWANPSVEDLNPMCEENPPTTSQCQDMHRMGERGGRPCSESKEGPFVNAVESSNRIPFGAIENVVKENKPFQTSQASLHTRAQMTNSRNGNKSPQHLIHDGQSHCDKHMKTGGSKRRDKVGECSRVCRNRIELSSACTNKLLSAHILAYCM